MNLEYILQAHGLQTQKDKRVFFYNEGEENINLTGGWVEGFTERTVMYQKEVSNLHIRSGYGTIGTAHGSYVTNSTINLTNIDKLYILWENIGQSSTSNKSALIVSTSKLDGNKVFDARVERENKFIPTIDILDVSQLNGDHYIRVHSFTNGSNQEYYSEIKVSQIWGE